MYFSALINVCVRATCETAIYDLRRGENVSIKNGAIKWQSDNDWIISIIQISIHFYPVIGSSLVNCQNQLFFVS